MQRNGRVNSGDVSIFYRAFGTRGAGAGAADARRQLFRFLRLDRRREALATDRETASFDKRGFGESGWSPSKDYSVDANMGDILAVIRELGWDKPIVVGHSASGRLSIAFAAAFPDKISRLIVVDSGMARDVGRQPPADRQSATNIRIGRRRDGAFRQALEPAAHLPRPSARGAALVKVDKGFMLKRDPDFGNTKPQGEGAGLAATRARDVWQDLAAIKCPIMMLRGLRSDRYTPEIIARIIRDYPKIEWATANSQHDVADQAPQELVASIRKFAAGA
jgi:pimeloyl-ACP methyl ester carboxylesterase